MKRFPVIVAVALVAAACSSPRGAERAPAYFDGLRPVAQAVTGAVAEVGDVFDQFYESQAMRTTRLTDLRTGSDLAIAADRAARLDPGSAYQADHDRYLATIGEIREIYRAFDAALAAGDMASAAVAATGMEAAAGIGFAGLAAEYCARVTFDMRLCDRPLDPDAYESILYTVMLDLTAGYTPLLRPAPLSLDAGEASGYLSYVDLAAAARLQHAVDTLSAAEPPAVYATDHAALVAMLEGAAATHAAGRGDADIPSVFCATADDLTEETGELAWIFFGDDDLDCPNR